MTTVNAVKQRRRGPLSAALGGPHATPGQGRRRRSSGERVRGGFSPEFVGTFATASQNTRRDLCSNEWRAPRPTRVVTRAGMAGVVAGDMDGGDPRHGELANGATASKTSGAKHVRRLRVRASMMDTLARSFGHRNVAGDELGGGELGHVGGTAPTGTTTAGRRRERGEAHRAAT